jgi:hypothetical protein
MNIEHKNVINVQSVKYGCRKLIPAHSNNIDHIASPHEAIISNYLLDPLFHILSLHLNQKAKNRDNEIIYDKQSTSLKSK